MAILLIAVGGAIGSVFRYWIGSWVQAATGPGFPWGTLVVNVSGSLLLAFLVRLLDDGAVPIELKGFLTLGFCGAYTTFSTFGYETMSLVQGGYSVRAALYVGASVTVSLIAIAAGTYLANWTMATR